MQGGERVEDGTAEQSEDPSPGINAMQPFELAWLKVRIGWQSVGKTRLDQDKKTAIAVLIRHYSESKKPDRQRSEFEQVRLRLEEEHALRVKELGRDERRALKFQTNPIEVVRNNSAGQLQVCRDRAAETPGLIEEWEQLIHSLFGDEHVAKFV